MKTKVALLFGGKSVEHEVSIISGIQALHSMNADKYDTTPVYLTKDNVMYVGDRVGDIEAYKDIPALTAASTRVILINEEGEPRLVSYPQKMFGKNLSIDIDVVIPVVHGTNVEDGALQGYLKTLGVTFAGCDVTASAVGMDKYVTKMVLKGADVPVLDALLFTRSDYEDMDRIVERIEERLGYPVIIKPANLGSSVGIGIAKERAALIRCIDDAYRYSGRVLAERAVIKLREVNCAVLGDELGARASMTEEPVRSDEILSYKDKYESSGGSKGMAGVTRRIPAQLDEETENRIKELAVRSFMALGCSGVARIDFIIDEEDGSVYFNEINTIPGSLSFYLWEGMGMSYTELLEEITDIAVKRERFNSSITYRFDTNILNMAKPLGSKGGKL